jgi:hypothetical protein
MRLAKVLRVNAIARDGQQFMMEYLLTHSASEEEKEYRKINSLLDDMLMLFCQKVKCFE